MPSDEPRSLSTSRAAAIPATKERSALPPVLVHWLDISSPSIGVSLYIVSRPYETINVLVGSGDNLSDRIVVLWDSLGGYSRNGRRYE